MALSKEHFTFWSDTCASQYPVWKSWTAVSFLPQKLGPHSACSATQLAISGKNYQNQCLFSPRNYFKIYAWVLKALLWQTSLWGCKGIYFCCYMVSPPWWGFQSCTGNTGLTLHHCNEKLSCTLQTAAKKMDLDWNTGARARAVEGSLQFPYMGRSAGRSWLQF